MNVALGRLTLSISMNTQPETIPAPKAQKARLSLEDAFIHDRTYREVESDRSRWTNTYRQMRGPVF